MTLWYTAKICIGECLLLVVVLIISLQISFYYTLWYRKIKINVFCKGINVKNFGQLRSQRSDRRDIVHLLCFTWWKALEKT